MIQNRLLLKVDIKIPHITNSVLRSCKYFRVKSHKFKFKNWSKSQDGDLFMHTIVNVNSSTIIWEAHALKIFASQNREVPLASVLYHIRSCVNKYAYFCVVCTWEIWD